MSYALVRLDDRQALAKASPSLLHPKMPLPSGTPHQRRSGPVGIQHLHSGSDNCFAIDQRGESSLGVTKNMFMPSIGYLLASHKADEIIVCSDAVRWGHQTSSSLKVSAFHVSIVGEFANARIRVRSPRMLDTSVEPSLLKVA
jgi:hypothetical protein